MSGTGRPIPLDLDVASLGSALPHLKAVSSNACGRLGNALGGDVDQEEDPVRIFRTNRVFSPTWFRCFCHIPTKTTSVGLMWS